jgi:DNA-binding transcriptional LysR family regulator
MDRWTEIEMFIKTVELGSITRASAEMNLSTTAGSRHLTELERRLSVRLLERNTRRQYLTEAGAQFFQRCKESVAIIKEAEAGASAGNDALSGTLNVSASVTFCVKHLGAVVAQFSQLYPELAIRVLADNHYSDLIADNIDVAVRTRQYEPDSNIIVRKLAESEVILAASPEYIARHGAPASPADLANHRLLVYSYAVSAAAWTFTRGDEKVEFKAKPKIEANDGLTLRSVALDHAGILFQAYYGIFDDVAAGRLVRVLPDWELPHLICNVAYRNREFVPAKVRKFIGFIQSSFKPVAEQGRWII